MLLDEYKRLIKTITQTRKARHAFYAIMAYTAEKKIKATQENENKLA
jgi:hypothetical protein